MILRWTLHHFLPPPSAKWGGSVGITGLTGFYGEEDEKEVITESNINTGMRVRV
jgi:hypothetical protein